MLNNLKKDNHTGKYKPKPRQKPMVWLCRLCLTAFITAVSLMALSSLAIIPAGNVIIVVKSNDNVQYDRAMQGFAQILEEKNIPAHLKIYGLENKDIIRGIKSQKPSLILTIGTTATKFISREIKDIPIVFSMIMDPRGSSLTSGHIVGASLDIPPQLQLEILATVATRFKRIGMIYNLPENETIARQAKQAANDLGFILNLYPVNSEKEIPKIKNLNIHLLWIIPDSTVCKPVIIRRILFSCLKNNVAVMGFSRQYARAGALLAVTCDYEDIGRQSAETAIRLLKGENYSHLEITVPRKVKFYLNKTVAHHFGITFPGEIIQKASEVFGQ